MTPNQDEVVDKVAEEVLNQIKEDESNHDSKEEKKQDNKPSYDELLDMLKRSQANLENFRKQTEKRIDDIREFAKRDVISKFIPVMDSFDLSHKEMPKDAPGQLGEVCTGIQMISDQLANTVNDLGVEIIDCTGKFDPTVHEALAKISNDKPEGTILAVFQPGFKLHGKVLRAARVQVSAGQK